MTITLNLWTVNVIPEVLITVVRMFLVSPVKKRCRAMLALGEEEGGKLKLLWSFKPFKSEILI